MQWAGLRWACADDAMARNQSRATIVRPGKVAGPTTGQDGLTYWVRRAARLAGWRCLATRISPVQVIDSRDLARLVIRLLTDDRPGAFHAVGSAERVTIGGLIETCARAAGTQVEVVPVPAETAPPPVFAADQGGLAGTAAQPGPRPGGGWARTGR